jgi:glycosyltransferase involved in cell wall biosynthesis
MKVLNVQPFDYFGSIQLRSLRVAEGLQRFGIETIFLVPQTKNSETRNLYSKVAIAKGFKVYKTSSVRPLFIKNLASLYRWFELLASFPKTFVQMYKLFETEKPDVVQINGFVCFQEALATSLFYNKKRSWVLISDLYPRSLIFAFSLLIRSFDRIFVSRKLLKYYLGRNGDQTIYEPVDTDFFSPDRVFSAEKEHVLLKFNLSKSSPLIVSTAMISPQKGLEFLILAIQKLKERFPQTKLVIIGDVIPSQKAYYQNLRELSVRIGVGKDVMFTRYIPVEELRSLLSVADVFAMSSINEGTPVSILEAMSMEKAVVATDVGGVSDQVVNGETGFLVSPKNSDALAEAIATMLQDSGKKAEMEKNARKRIQAMFSIQSCVQQYKEYYLNDCSDQTRKNGASNK